MNIDEIKTAFDDHARSVAANFTGLMKRCDEFATQIKAANEIATEAAKRAGRTALLGSSTLAGAEAEEKALAEFNHQRRSLALERKMTPPADLDNDGYREYRAALANYLRRGETGHPDERKAMSVGNDPSGGYLVPPDMGGRIARKIFETSPIRQIASVQLVASDALEGLNDLEEMSAGWVSETGARAATATAQVGKWRISAEELYAMPEVSQKLLDDAVIDVEAWVGDKIGARLGRMEGTAFVAGDGVGKPRGFTTYTTAATADDTRAWGVIEHLATGTSGGFGTDPNGADKLVDLTHKLKAPYRANASFVMSKGTLGAARKLKDGNGRFVFTDSLVRGMPGLLLGYPVVEAEDMPAIAANSLSIAFGDFMAGYQIVDRIGIRVLRDPFTNKPYVRFYTTKRVGGGVINFDAIKFLKFGTS